MTPLRVWPGRSYPLGATWDGNGVNFAIFAEHALRVELCLFESADAPEESHRVVLREHNHHVWHGFLPDVQAGQVYGFRVHGPFEPAAGLRFNASKLLLDPYAKVIARDVVWDESLYSGDGEQPDQRDSVLHAPRAAVADTRFDWGDDARPQTPWHETVVYEVHVKGFTKLHPGVPAALQGTYAGLASPAAIAHLHDLGVTAVELLPVHYHFDDRFLVEQGRVNYWGYNTLGFLAPDPRYAAGGTAGALDEFKAMVRDLHKAGIEVILDVVYNHTAEGDQRGPTISLRGIDNIAYYRLESTDRRRYVDFTGCGNSLNVGHPRVLQLIMDSLRYWVLEMHVDGLRFDLASTLGRDSWEVDRLAAFFDIIHQDPVLSQVKLIAEPWDLGPSGYQVGNFPVLWTEWNGKFRDCVRRFWKGDGGTLGEMASRLSGSSDLYLHNGRRPNASLNFITCHDGFTLADLVSYNSKHNEANGEDNRDGANDNESWNCGVEGQTHDLEILALRDRQRRNLLATLLLSQGVPMLLAGDEFSHSQLGNNNAYCQDSPLGWLNWELGERQREEFEFVRKLLALRKSQPVFRRRGFFKGRPVHGTKIKDVNWLSQHGREMIDNEWRDANVRCVGMGLPGHQIQEPDEQGRRIVGDSFLLLFNAGAEPVEFRLGGHVGALSWVCEFDTARPQRIAEFLGTLAHYPMEGRSMVLLRRDPPAEIQPD